MSPFMSGLFYVMIGILSGLAIAYTYIEPRYEKSMEQLSIDIQEECLKTIRDNYQKEMTTRALLLQELGEELDVDVVYLPSFGHVILKQASITIPEDIIEAVIGE